MARIHVHEPDATMRQLLEVQLEHLGHVPAAADEPFDIAVVEPADPDGLSLSSELREQRPELPLIFVSTLPPDPRTEALRPYAHLLKPYELRALASAIEGAVEMLP
jgi:CheY-like chemotaxis protein